MEEEYNTLNNWNDLVSVNFRSTTIPVKSESSGIITNNGSSLNQNVIGNEISIITDFEPINQGNLRQNLQYFPPGEYRLTDLLSSIPLYNIDIRIYWTDKRGNQHRLRLSPGTLITIKIMFINKELKRLVG